LPFGLKQLTSLIFQFAKDFLAKKVLMTAQRDLRLGNSLLTADAVITLASSLVRQLAKQIGYEISF